MIGRSSDPDEPTLYGDLTMADADRFERASDAFMNKLLADPAKADAVLRKLGIIDKDAPGADKPSCP